jgi:hypothetical protein
MDMEFPGMPAPRVAELYDTGQANEADSIIAGYYRQRIPFIKNELAITYPSRSPILMKAFRLHEAMDYDVCVPLFLIHADGICKEVFRTHFFKVNKNGLIARQSVERRKVDWIWQAVAEPFRLPLPIAEGCRDRTAWNRHVILHGINLDYGTEINSLKAISLLSFLCGLDTYAKTKDMERSFQLPVDAQLEDIDLLLERIRAAETVVD